MKYFSKSFSSRRNLRPPELYEYFVDNFWFKTADLENEKINEPLRGSRKADIAIIGGGYTGLSAAYNLNQRFPDKKIILLEGACCGYGARLEGLRIDHAWGGTMSGTRGFTPSVGVMGEHQNIFYGVGYFEGVPTSQTAGRIIADLMAGESNEFTNHYIANHKIPYAGPKSLRAGFGKIAKAWMVRFSHAQ